VRKKRSWKKEENKGFANITREEINNHERLIEHSVPGKFKGGKERTQKNRQRRR
jgi:hypothetical protein